MTRASGPWSRPASALLAVSALVLGGCDSKNLTNVDRTPPEVAITSPAADEAVSGVTFVVEVTATDDVAVDRVELFVNDELVNLDTTAPYRMLVFTLPFAELDPLLVTARAVDTSENAAATSVTAIVSLRTVTNLTQTPQPELNPSWSPDGASIAFEARRPEGHFDIWTMDTDGGNEIRLTSNTNEDRNPAWSPAGDVIAFDSNRAGTYDIWILPVATGEIDADSLTFGNLDDVEPAWSPDAATVWFASNRGDNAPFSLWSVPATGGPQFPVTSFLSNDTSPTASPEGLLLAFVSDLNVPRPKVYTMFVGASEVTLLTSASETEADPAWDPTGTAILYTRTDGSGSRIWGVPWQGGVAPTQITFGFDDGGASFSPDASKIAYHSRQGTSGDNFDIFVLE